MDLPWVDAGGHLVGYLFEVGPTEGDGPLTFREIQAWRSETGAVLDSWEVATLRRLSIAFLSEYQAASDAKRPPPYAPEARTLTRAEVSDRIGSILDRWERQDEKAGLAALEPKPKRRRQRPAKGTVIRS